MTRTYPETVLITGVAGFIGMHMAQCLSNQGIRVIGLDNLNDYYDVQLKLDRLKQLGIDCKEDDKGELIWGSAGVGFVKADLTDKAAVNRLFVEFQFDKVLHLAAQAGVRYSIDAPEVYIQSNVVGFFNVLEACRHARVKHLVYASSSSVYGLNSKVPFSEHDNVDHPISLYAATKKSNELMAHTYSHLFGIPVTGLRFFTVYGPWGRPDMALFKFTKAILEQSPIEVYNHGKMSRDFTYIDDIVEGVRRVLNNSPQVGEKDDMPGAAPYRVINIGRNEPVSLESFISAIESSTGMEAVRIDLPIQPGDVEQTFADVSDLFRITGYRPTIDVEEGVERFVNWYKEYYNEKA